jgi:hypothetical protein
MTGNPATQPKGSDHFAPLESSPNVNSSDSMRCTSCRPWTVLIRDRFVAHEFFQERLSLNHIVDTTKQLLRVQIEESLRYLSATTEANAYEKVVQYFPAFDSIQVRVMPSVRNLRTEISLSAFSCVRFPLWLTKHLNFLAAAASPTHWVAETVQLLSKHSSFFGSVMAVTVFLAYEPDVSDSQFEVQPILSPQADCCCEWMLALSMESSSHRIGNFCSDPAMGSSRAASTPRSGGLVRDLARAFEDLLEVLSASARLEAKEQETVETVLRGSLDSVVNAPSGEQLLQEYMNLGKKMRDISSVAKELEGPPPTRRLPMRVGRHGNAGWWLRMNFIDRSNLWQSMRENSLRSRRHWRNVEEDRECTFRPRINHPSY